MSRPEEAEESASTPEAEPAEATEDAPTDAATAESKSEAEAEAPAPEPSAEEADAAAEAAIASAKEDAAAKEAPKKKKVTASGKGVQAGRQGGKIRRVLVVEDSPPLRRMIEKLLHADGFEVQVAENGEAAHKKLNSSEIAFDLMLLDIMMPGMDGIQLMAQLKKEEFDRIPPVVICSSRSDRETIQLVGRLGAVGYILKPFKTETVLGKVHDALGIDADA